MGSFNGATHLTEQLDSFLAQEHTVWDLWVSDDGSTDQTRAILDAFKQTHGAQHEIRVIDGPRRGSAANFLALLCHPDLPPGPVALSDQDDVWLPHKLSRALRMLQSAGPIALYGGQSLHVDANLKEIGRSRLGHARPSFRNAVTQNVISGHSTVISAAALEIVRQAGPQPVPHHDWWLYQLLSAAGADVLVDPLPVLMYRQHGSNVMGAHQGLGAWRARAAQVLGHEYGDWISCNLQSLRQVAHLLTPESRAILEDLIKCPRPAHQEKARFTKAARRAFAMSRHGIARQSRLQTLVFYTASLLGRV